MTTLYIITFSTVGRFTGGRMTGTYEMDMDRMTLSNIAQDIIDGQFPDVRRVYEATPGQDCADVTEDVALLVATALKMDGAELEYGLKTWLHSVLGVDSTRGMVEA